MKKQSAKMIGDYQPSIHQQAMDNVSRHIAAAEQAGQHLSPDEIETLYAQCLAIAEKERNGHYFK